MAKETYVENVSYSDDDDDDPDMEDLEAKDDLYEEIVDKAAQKPNTFKFGTDAYANAFLSVVKPRRGDSNACCQCVRMLVGTGIMLFVWIMQVIITIEVWQQAYHTDQSFKFRIANIIDSSHFGSGSLDTRITADAAGDICGSYREEFPQAPGYDPTMDGPSTNFLDYWSPSDQWSQDPVLWSSDSMSKLHASIKGLYLLNFQHLAFYAYMIAVMSWTITFLVELRDDAKFLRVVCTRRNEVEIVENDDGDPELVGIRWWHKAYAGLIGVLQISLAVFLYITGCLFLRTDLDITNLILNCVALGFILEIDTILYTGFTIFSSHVLNDVLVIKYPRNVKFEHTWSPILGICAFAFIAIMAFVNWLLLKDLLEQRFAAYATVCLFTGATVNTMQGFNVSFAVPGMCETMICTKVSSPSGLCLEPLLGDNCDYGECNKYVRMLEGQCMQMLQKNNATKYKVEEKGTVWYAPPGTRMTDHSLASALITDDAANFWCPTETVLQRINPGTTSTLADDIRYGRQSTSWLLDTSLDTDVILGDTSCQQDLVGRVR